MPYPKTTIWECSNCHKLKHLENLLSTEYNKQNSLRAFGLKRPKSWTNLIEFCGVTLLQGHPGVRLVHLDGELIANTLYLNTDKGKNLIS